MISFRNDYSEGAHPKVLDAIARCNLEQACGYSTDPRCAAAKDIIRARWLDEDNKSTLQELADRYGVSAERVRQLEKNAMKKLRAAIEA